MAVKLKGELKSSVREAGVIRELNLRSEGNVLTELDSEPWPRRHEAWKRSKMVVSGTRVPTEKNLGRKCEETTPKRAAPGQ